MNRLYIFILIVLIGCTTVEDKENVVEVPKEERIPRLIQILHLAKGENYWRLCQTIIDYKEDALVHLEKNIASSSKKIRIGAIYCTARIYVDTKSTEALKLKSLIAGRLEDREVSVQLEAAASLCDMKDYNGVPVLIGIGLRNDNKIVRYRAQQTLRNIFKLNFNYQFTASLEDREKGINRWEKWWEENKNKYLNAS